MTSYPKLTGHLCPECGAPVVLDEWTRTTADHNGEPQEQTGTGYYCTNNSCVHINEPLDISPDDHE